MSLTDRLERLEDAVAVRERVQLVAVTLDRETCPPWAEPLEGTRGVRVVGGDRAERRRVAAALRKEVRTGRPLDDVAMDGVVVLQAKRGASRFIAEVVGGKTFEVACWGARGDRKSSSALLAVTLLADLHMEAGGALPFRVMVPTDTHASHVLKLCRTLVAPHWAGMWSLRDSAHLGVLTIAGVEMVHLDLFGAGDPGALDRLRMESHALWAEEVAPAAYEAAAGVSADAWALGMTSIRLPTRRPVAFITSNMPDEDHWSWQRFEAHPHPGTASIRIPAGESASAADRERWAIALQNRPDLLQRLLAGEPGAKGYNALAHVAPRPLDIVRYADVYVGWDSAPNAHCHATVIGQRIGAEVRVYASLVSEETGLKQHLEVMVLPWFARRMPWVLQRGGTERLLHRYDPAMDTGEGGDIDMNPVARIRRSLGGSLQKGAVDWPSRSGPMLALLNQGNGRGGMALQMDPGEDTDALRRALGGRWHYAVTRAGTVIRDLPMKPNHPHEDAGDAFAYFIGGIAPSRDLAAMGRPPKIDKDPGLWARQRERYGMPRGSGRR